MRDEPKLILPITDRQVNSLVGWNKEPDGDEVIAKLEDWAANAPIEQVISALLIQQVPALIAKRKPVATSLETVLARLIETVKGEAEEAELRRTAPQQIDLQRITDGARHLAPHGIDVLRQAETDPDVDADKGLAGFLGTKVPEPLDYLDKHGSWDFEFTVRQHRRRDPFIREVDAAGGQIVKMTDPQARFFNTFLSQPDESAHLMSFFGGGKTYLAKEMLNVIEQHKEFRPVILALTQDQLQGLLGRLNAPNTKARTFGQMATEILANQNIPSQWRPGKRRNPQYMLTSAEIARRLQMQPVGRLAASSVADIAMKAVRRFCMSGQDFLMERHLPTIRDRVDQIDRAALVGYAQELWDETVEPSDPASELPVRAYHLIKYCALRGFTIPENYTHLIIDEAHDLSKPMMQILDASPQAIQTMGDPYQRVRGAVPRRAPTVRKSEIGLTVRASNQVEGIFNTLIEKHPTQTSVYLQGSRHIRTRISYYDPERPRIPREPSTILVSDLFELTEWFHRLREAGVAFSLLQGSHHDFFAFNASLVGLYFNGIRAQSHVLFRYPDWDSLRQEKGHTRAFQRVEAMFAHGSDRRDDFAKAMDIVTSPDKATIILGLAEHARNMEFDRVMLAPDLLIEPGQIREAAMQAHVLSTIYIGASRARFELMLPGHLRDWLQMQPVFSENQIDD